MCSVIRKSGTELLELIEQKSLSRKANNDIYTPMLGKEYNFNKGFKLLCRTLRRRVRKDYDAVLAITGDEGTSKSTLANQIGFKTDKRYTLEKNCIFSPKVETLINAVKFLPRFSAVNADEAIKILYKQQWWLQSFINKFYRLCRQENKISILCMPRFSEFNEGFRNHRIIFWVHLFDRGIGVIFEKDWSPFVKDPWHFDDNQKRIKAYSKRKKYHSFSINDKMSALKNSPNMLDVITFPDLEEDTRVRYKHLAAEHKYEGLEEEYDQGTKNSAMKKRYQGRINKLLKVTKDKTGFTEKEIAKLMGIPRTTLRDSAGMREKTGDDGEG